MLRVYGQRGITICISTDVKGVFGFLDNRTLFLKLQNGGKVKVTNLSTLQAARVYTLHMWTFIETSRHHGSRLV